MELIGHPAERQPTANTALVSGATRREPFRQELDVITRPGEGRSMTGSQGQIAAERNWSLSAAGDYVRAAVSGCR
jgi:hypothetical protein